MNLTILGCRAGMPANGQASSGYLVASDTTSILLDCGPGVATSLSAITSPNRLDAVIVSHLHVDHCFDLLPVGKTLLAASAGYPAPDEPPQTHVDVDAVPLYVPGGAADTLGRLATLFPVATAPVLDRVFELAYDVREYTAGASFDIGDMTVTLFGLRHSAPNCGVRIDSPTGSLAYTGDTGITPALQALAADVDLLLAEATLPATDNGPHGHLSATDAGHVAESASAGSLVLTHLPSADPAWLLARREEAAAVYRGAVYIAQPGETFEARPVSAAIAYRRKALS